MKKKCLLLLLFAVSEVFAQQDALFSNYMFPQMYATPAAVGTEGVIRFQLLSRSQWSGYQATFDDGGSPTTQLFTASMPLPRLKSGIGLYAVNDKIAQSTNQQVQLAYSYQLILPAGTLALGVRAGLFSRALAGNLRPRDPNDPIIPTSSVSQTRPDVSIGAYYYSSSYYVGISLNHVNNSKFTFNFDNAQNALQQTMYVTGGYTYLLTDRVEIIPSFMFRTDFSRISADINTLFQYDSKYWIGGGYRTSEGVVALIGANWGKNNAIKTGLSIDIVLNGMSAKSQNSTELFLSYALPVPKNTQKSIVRTPRFRF